MNRLIADVQEVMDDFRTEPFEFLDTGDKVVAGLIHRGRGKGSSAEVEMREWNVFLISRWPYRLGPTRYQRPRPKPSKPPGSRSRRCRRRTWRWCAALEGFQAGMERGDPGAVFDAETSLPMPSGSARGDRRRTVWVGRGSSSSSDAPGPTSSRAGRLRSSN